MYTKNSPPQPVFDEFQMKVFESHQKVKRLISDLSKETTNESSSLQNTEYIFQKYQYITIKDLHRSKRTLQSIIEEVMTRRICGEVFKTL